LDPENSLVLMETSLPTPMTARVYVNLPEGMMNIYELRLETWDEHWEVPKSRILRIKNWLVVWNMA